MSDPIILTYKDVSIQPVVIRFYDGVHETAVKAMAEGLKTAGYKQVRVLLEKIEQVEI